MTLPKVSWTQCAEDLPAEPGAYVLRIKLTKPTPLPTRFAKEPLPPGDYLYLGSANGPSGIAARCRRHLKKEKKKHWHVDWLTSSAEEITVLAIPGGTECDLVESLLESDQISTPVQGFGSTDCRTCRAHLLAVGHGVTDSWISTHLAS